MYETESDRISILESLRDTGYVKDLRIGFVSKEGRCTITKMYSKVVDINGSKFIVSSFIDISEKEKAEMALWHSNERLQGIMDTMDDSYFQVNMKGVITYANQTAPAMFGFSTPDELIGSPIVGLYKNKDDRKRMLAELKEIGNVVDYIVQFQRKNGSLFWGSMNTRFMYDKPDPQCLQIYRKRFR